MPRLHLDAVRLRDALTLAGRMAAAHGTLPWVSLAPGLEGRPIRAPGPGALTWNPEAAAEGLAPLCLDEDAVYLARMPRDARWDPSLTRVVTPLWCDPGDGAGGEGLWAVAFRGRAGGAVLQATRGGAPWCRLPVEVTPRKIDPVTAHRAMVDALGAIGWAHALALEGAVTTITVSHGSAPPGSPWARFQALRCVLRGDTLADAVATVCRRPVAHLVATRRAVRADRAHRVTPEELALRGTGAAHGVPPGAVWESAPVLSHAVPENRFVHRALTELAHAAVALAGDPAVPELHAGAAAMATRLASMATAVAHRVGTHPGAIAHVPVDALVRRAGYREVLAAWQILCQGITAAGPGTTAQGVPTTATLYERWTALEVGTALGFTPGALARLLAGDVVTRAAPGGTRVTVQQQRAFPRGRGSYTLGFRPDLVIESGGRRLVLDAKYRVGRQGSGGGPARETPRPVPGLVKMHAYRDAIEAVWGAVVLFPGTGSHADWYPARDGQGGVGMVPLRPGGGGRRLAAQRAALGEVIARFLTGASG